jgi:hypothetical protein
VANFFVSAFFILAMTAQASEAAERWICNYTATSDRTHGGIVSFLASEATLFESPYDTRFNILENNDHALLAEHHYADYDYVLLRPNIFLMAVMIDKATRQLTYTTTLSGQTPTSYFGSCERRDL